MGLTRVLGQRILVQREAVDEAIGHIIIPAKYRSMSQIGIVKAVGPEVEDIVPGDKVLFGRYAGTAIQVEGKECVLLWARDVMGVIE